MVNSGGGGCHPRAHGPSPLRKAHAPIQLWRNTPVTKAQAVGGTRAAQELQDYRARLGITQLTSATLVSPSPWHPEVTVMLG